MMPADIVAALPQLGATSAFIIYLIWREKVRDERETKREDRFEAILKDITAANKDLAVALTLISERVR